MRPASLILTVRLLLALAPRLALAGAPMQTSQPVDGSGVALDPTGKTRALASLSPAL
jgi:hypothetical protein